MSLGSSDSSVLAMRHSGVKVARDAATAPRAIPQHVNHVVRGEIVFVNYNDTAGVEQTAMYFKVGNRLVSTADTTTWCATKLFPIAEWMREEVERQLEDSKKGKAGSAGVTLPTDDSVDVMG